MFEQSPVTPFESDPLFPSAARRQGVTSNFSRESTNLSEEWQPPDKWELHYQPYVLPQRSPRIRHFNFGSPECPLYTASQRTIAWAAAGLIFVLWFILFASVGKLEKSLLPQETILPPPQLEKTPPVLPLRPPETVGQQTEGQQRSRPASPEEQALILLFLQRLEAGRR
jgi:hypothetical protein